MEDNNTIIEEPIKLDENRLPDGTFKEGHQKIPGSGRPKGKTLKEWVREKLANMTEEEREEYIKVIPKDIVWKMAEGNPQSDLTTGGEKLPTPIYAGKSIQGHNGDQADIQPEQKD